MRRALPSLCVALAIFAALFVYPVSCQAQVTAGSKVLWTQTAVDLPSASAFVYKYYADGSTTGIVLPGAVCVAPAPATVPPSFNCSAPIPAFTPGAHSIVLTATDVTIASTPLESPKSSPPVTFRLVLVPSAPANVQVAQAPIALAPAAGDQQQ